MAELSTINYDHVIHRFENKAGEGYLISKDISPNFMLSREHVVEEFGKTGKRNANAGEKVHKRKRYFGSLAHCLKRAAEYAAWDDVRRLEEYAGLLQGYLHTFKAVLLEKGMEYK